MQKSSWAQFGSLVVLVAGIASCGSDAGPDSAWAGGDPVEAAAPDSAKGRAGMPPELRAAYIAAVQAGAPEAYHAMQDGAAVRAQNPAQRMSAEFTSAGVQLAPSGGEDGWRWSMETVGYGCEGELAPVESAAPEIATGRIEYRRGELVEWYVNGPLGVEQGFTIASAPACRATGGGPVTLELAAESSMLAALVDGGDAVEWRDERGHAVLRYTDAYAMDAIGRWLPIRLAVEDGRVSIRVDDSGAVYPIVVDPLVWTEQEKLLPSNGIANGSFGRAVAIDGDTAIIGGNVSDGSTLGVTYVFVRSGSTWSQQQQLTRPTDANSFGWSVAVSGDTAVVGAPGTVIGGQPKGAAYVFVRSGSSWSLQQQIVASDGASFDNFGFSVDIDGDTAVVGAHGDDTRSGSAYVFVYSGSSWSEEAKLTASDATTGDELGRSVAIDGDTVVAGAYLDDDNGSQAGAAYVFVRSGSSWSEEAKLLASDGSAFDDFGFVVDISGDTAIVGAKDDDTPLTSSGSAYVFVRSGSSWSQQQKLVASDSAFGGGFGSYLAIDGDTAVVGSPGGSISTTASGSAYVFVRSGSSWTEQQEIAASDGAASDAFGRVAISGDTIIVGVPGDDDNGNTSGSAYIFVLEEE